MNSCLRRPRVAGGPGSSSTSEREAADRIVAPEAPGSPSIAASGGPLLRCDSHSHCGIEGDRQGASRPFSRREPWASGANRRSGRGGDPKAAGSGPASPPARRTTSGRCTPARGSARARSRGLLSGSVGHTCIEATHSVSVTRLLRVIGCLTPVTLLDQNHHADDCHPGSGTRPAGCP